MNLLLTISLLASNRIHSLERCLDSLKPLLQRVPSELIVVFTGTDERVRETAARYTDQIVPFTWCNDFSKARNAGLSRAKGEWFLYIDDDEWFEDVEEFCTFFLSGEYRSYRSACYIQRNYVDWEGRKYADFSAFRMARRVPGLSFQNPIHEELVPGDGPYKLFQTIAHHYGYLKDAKPETQKKQDRNTPLLLEDIQKRPDYLKNYLQITKEYVVKQEWEAADRYCRKGLELCRNTKPHFRRWLLVYLGRISCRLNTAQKAAEEIRQILEKEKPCELVSLILYQLLIVKYMDLGRGEEALKYGRKYEKAFSYMEKHPEQWTLQSYGDITKEEVTDPERILSVWLNCVAASLEQKDAETALFFLKKLPWSEEFQLLQYYPLFDRWKTKYQEFVQDLFLKLPEQASYLLLQRLLAAPENDVCFRRCAEEIEHPYLQEQVLRTGILHQKELSVLAFGMDLHTWERSLEAVLKNLPDSEMEKLWSSRKQLAKRCPLQAYWFEKQLLERELFRGYLLGDAFVEKIRAYCQCMLSYYQGIFREEILEESMYLLPADGRYAAMALQALECLEQGRQPEAVRLLREGLRIYPKMTGVTRELMRQISRESGTIAGAAGEEFGQLAVQMKAALRTMLENKQYAEAEAVVSQLTPLLPEDLEFLRLRQRLFRESTH